MKNIRYYIPGGILILLAVVVLAVPQILVALVAASISMVGIFLLYVGHTIRRSKRGLSYIDMSLFEDRDLSSPFVSQSYHCN